MFRLSRRGAVGVFAGVVALAGAGVVPAVAAPAPSKATRFAETDLVSDLAGRAKVQDKLLVNPWGLSHSPTSPLWVSNNGSDSSTLYSSTAKVPLNVSVAGGAPTGQVFHNPADGNFVVSGGGKSAPAVFIFDSEAGDITAWAPSVDGTHAIKVAQGKNAVYKGLASMDTPFGPFLLAADFRNARIDVFDSKFRRLPLPREFFHDSSLPRGYAPFNVATIGNSVYVAYAKQDAKKHDEVDGAGLGFVDVYTDIGLRVHRFSSRGALNAPWGIEVAPASFGQFAGDILIGNFGNGWINAFNRKGHLVGPLRNTKGNPIVIQGLWGLLAGTASNGGTDALWFSAGIDHENHGLLGLIKPAK